MDVRDMDGWGGGDVERLKDDDENEDGRQKRRRMGRLTKKEGEAGNGPKRTERGRTGPMHEGTERGREKERRRDVRKDASKTDGKKKEKNEGQEERRDRMILVHLLRFCFFFFLGADRGGAPRKKNSLFPIPYLIFRPLVFRLTVNVFGCLLANMLKTRRGLGGDPLPPTKPSQNPSHRHHIVILSLLTPYTQKKARPQHLKTGQRVSRTAHKRQSSPEALGIA